MSPYSFCAYITVMKIAMGYKLYTVNDVLKILSYYLLARIKNSSSLPTN